MKMSTCGSEVSDQFNLQQRWPQFEARFQDFIISTPFTPDIHPISVTHQNFNFVPSFLLHERSVLMKNTCSSTLEDFLYSVLY